MVEANFVSSFMPVIMNLLKMGFFIFVFGILVAIGIVIIIQLKRRKWHVTIKEQRADGKLYFIKKDVMVERKINKGMTTIYWLTKSKVEAIPPPDDCVERVKNKDYVTYLRIERDYIPTKESLTQDYTDKRIKSKFAEIFDKQVKNIRAIKTTYFDSRPVRERFIHVPTNKALVANFRYTPIDYDMSMMSQNEINHADAFFKMKGEFWAKYGAYILFALTIVFLIIVVVLTFNHASDFLDSAFNAAQSVATGVSGNGGAPPS